MSETVYERCHWQTGNRAAWKEAQERERLAKEQKDRELLAAEIAKAIAKLPAGEPKP